MQRLTSPNLSVMLRHAGIVHFTATELLTPGAQHRAGKAINTPPPADLARNLIQIAREADSLRKAFGHPIIILSAYRSPDYNAAIKGASRSYHLRAGALDLAPQDGRLTTDLINLAMDRASEGKFVGGLGTYSWGIHIDIGPPRRW